MTTNSFRYEFSVPYYFGFNLEQISPHREEMTDTVMTVGIKSTCPRQEVLETIAMEHSTFTTNISHLDQYTCVDGMDTTDGELYQYHRWWLEAILHIVICGVGFVTNLISIRVLLSSEMKNLFNITLAILAIFDAVYNFCDIAESLRIEHYEENICEMPLHQKIHLNTFS